MAYKPMPLVLPKETSRCPSPRSGHRCVSDSGSLYVYGGYSPLHEAKLFHELWKFNYATKTWSQVVTSGNFPGEVASSCVVLDRGNLIVFGGSGYPFGYFNSNKLFVCNLKEKQWVQIEWINTINANSEVESELEGSVPLPGYGQSVVLSPDRELYIFGGTTGLQFNSHLHRFSFTKCEWEHLVYEKFPCRRYRHEAVSDSTRFYVIGGGIGNSDPRGEFSLENVHSFHFEKHQWKLHPCQPCSSTGEFPNRRRCHGCVIWGGNIYICGGYDGTDIFDDIWSLDLSSFQWRKLSIVLSYPVFFHSAAVTPVGCLYVFGGVKSLGSDAPRSNEIHRLWLTVPPLLEQCWEMVCKLISGIKNMKTEDLIKFGVPLNLIQRLK